MKRRIAVALIAAAALAAGVVGCVSREDAADHANDTCAGHGGVSKFWYNTGSDGTYEFGCRDGYYEAHDE